MSGYSFAGAPSDHAFLVAREAPAYWLFPVCLELFLAVILNG